MRGLFFEPEQITGLWATSRLSTDPQATQGASEVGCTVRTVEPHRSAQRTLSDCALDVLREVPVDFFTELGLSLLEAP